MLALNFKWRVPEEENRGDEKAAATDEKAKAMQRLKRMKTYHRTVKAECQAGDASKCDEQAIVEEQMLALNAKWRDPEGDNRGEAKDGEKAAAMEQLKLFKATHKEVKKECL